MKDALNKTVAHIMFEEQVDSEKGIPITEELGRPKAGHTWIKYRNEFLWYKIKDSTYSRLPIFSYGKIGHFFSLLSGSHLQHMDPGNDTRISGFLLFGLFLSMYLITGLGTCSSSWLSAQTPTCTHPCTSSSPICPLWTCASPPPP